jgi:lysophospholipase L1-like esterase
MVAVERKHAGGSCPNIACLPSKNSAKVASSFYRSNEFGISKENARIKMADKGERKKLTSVAGSLFFSFSPVFLALTMKFVEYSVCMTLLQQSQEFIIMKRLYSSGLCLVLACSLPALGAETNATPAPASAGNSAATPAPHLNDHGDTQRKLGRFSGKHFDLVFDGDSIMNRWETTGQALWKERYAAMTADFGIEGDHVENVLWRLAHGQVDGVDPKVVMLMIGTNNSGQNSADEIAEGIKKLVADYEKRCPHAHIILMGIFPRGEKSADRGRRKVAAVNDQIKGLADGQRVSFIDISDQMIEPDGTVSRDMMPDFVHPTAKGYQIWADAIQPVINQYIPAK